jgi:DNA replication and repair protein RecF
MFLEKITLTNFKNYAHQTLVLSPRLNAFVGLNGMGKTNFLDAIYYLCLCKSYFLTLDSDVILKNEENPHLEAANTEGGILSPQLTHFMRLEGHFQRKEQREKIVAKVQPRKKKVFERNDVAYAALSDHIGFLPVVMIAPDDTELVREGSEERRRFLDNALSQLDNNYLRHLILYNRLLEQRNAALKKYEKDPTRTVELAQLLTTYDHQMSPSAVYIFQKRQDFVRDFEPIFNNFYQKIADNRESVKIIHKNGFGTTDDSFTTEWVEQQWQAARDRDRALQRTTVGIHRDDWVFEMGGKLLKKFGSQGQLKSFVIALKLAQFEILRGVLSDNPILLLDDIFDKLDETRVQNLLQLIVNQSFGQIFLTDTHPDRVSKLFDALTTDSRHFTVQNGQIEVDRM